MNDVVCLGILVADIWGRPIDSWPQKGRLSLVTPVTVSSTTAQRLAGRPKSRMAAR